MPGVFNIGVVAFSLLGYDISYIELVGTLAGLLSVWFGTKNHILYWYIGLLNVTAFFLIFFQLQLYADMLLQFLYLCITLYGIFAWRQQKTERKIARLTPWEAAVWLVFSFVFLGLFWGFATHLNWFFPNVQNASYPIADSLLSAFSVTATILIAKRKAEAWLIWIIVDFASVLLYLQKSVLFITIEYAIFGFLAVQGYILWQKQLMSHRL